MTNRSSNDDLLRLACSGTSPVRVLRLLRRSTAQSVVRYLRADPALPESARAVLETTGKDLRQKLESLDMTFLPLAPDEARMVDDAPAWLFVRGSLPDELGVAVVGSRRATSYGLKAAQDIGAAVGASGIPVISGLALGIDGAAHRGCLRAGGATVAVLGSGVDVLYPARHRSLAGEILRSGGAIVSEYPPGTSPAPWRFPLRNRIIAGASRAVVVVEAAERSGALITARLALELGLDVFAVPGDIHRETSIGTNKLIRDGAHPVASIDELLEALGVQAVSPVDPLDLDVVPGEQLTVDQLAARHPSRRVSDLVATVARLEIQGRLVVEGGVIEVPRQTGAKS